MDIEKNVLRLISEQSGFPVDEIEGDDNVLDLDMDSLDKVELIMHTEDQFDIEIPDAHAERLKTVRDIIDYVTSET